MQRGRTHPRDGGRAALMGLGVGVLLAPRGAMRAMLFGETNAAGHAVARLVGARDLALGLATLAAREDRRSLRRLTMTGGLLDVADAVALGLSARQPGTRLAGLGGVLFAWLRRRAQRLCRAPAGTRLACPDFAKPI